MRYCLYFLLFFAAAVLAVVAAGFAAGTFAVAAAVFTAGFTGSVLTAAAALGASALTVSFFAVAVAGFLQQTLPVPSFYSCSSLRCFCLFAAGFAGLSSQPEPLPWEQPPSSAWAEYPERCGMPRSFPIHRRVPVQRFLRYAERPAGQRNLRIPVHASL